MLLKIFVLYKLLEFRIEKVPRNDDVDGTAAAAAAAFDVCIIGYHVSIQDDDDYDDDDDDDYDYDERDSIDSARARAVNDIQGVGVAAGSDKTGPATKAKLSTAEVETIQALSAAEAALKAVQVGGVFIYLLFGSLDGW